MLNNNYKFKLLAAFREMRQKIVMSDFDARLVFQKKTYLLQELGLQLGLSFGWYKRGPYSSIAADYGYQLLEIQTKELDLPELSRDELKAIDQFEKMFSKAKKIFVGFEEVDILELLGSLHFVIKHGYPRSRDLETAKETFVLFKPRFKDKTDLAIKLLEENRLVG